MADVVIVGGGIIGLSAAWELATQGARVTVIDAAHPGQASQAAAGMLAPSAEFEQAGPMAEIAWESLRRWQGWAARLREETGHAADLTGPGLLRLADDQEPPSVLARAAAWLQCADLPCELLDADALRSLEPALGERAAAALYSPQERSVDPRRFLAALRDACRRRGVSCLNALAQGLETAGRRILAVRTDRGPFLGERFLFAGGAWTGAMGEWLGLRVPIRPVRGQIAALGPCRPLPFRHTLYGPGLYLVPRPTGRVLVGATMEDAGFDARNTAAGIAGLLTQAFAWTPCLADASFEEAWTGLRPVTADGLPLLGPAPRWDNACLAAGHGRNGILLAPETARRVAAHCADGTPLPPEFAPARFEESPCPSR